VGPRRVRVFADEGGRSLDEEAAGRRFSFDGTMDI
jgi:hypothetical protein